MKLSAGNHVGPYEIVAPLGAGGMGEVYRALDPRIGREVAIKILPSALAESADGLHRFEQEARAAGMLNHPNLLTVFELGSHEGSPYIVSELLEGETLREVLGSGLGGGNGGSAPPTGTSSRSTIRGKPVSVRRGMGYAHQIASGLAAAHEKGIVHRDLKPENLFVTRDGRVKILDFGLAKLMAAAATDGVDASTAMRHTDPGTVMGTVGYMSPEQVRGQQADHRSDIFSFGAILYELLSGQRAFHADSSVETMNAILKEDPPELDELVTQLPPGLERIVRHCLEKNPEQRFQSARDLAFDLEALSSPSGESRSRPGAVKAMRHSSRMILGAAAAAFLTGAMVSGFAVWKLRQESKGGDSAEATRSVRELTLGGNEAWPSLAPDGKFVVFSAGVENEDIYLQRLGGRNAINLTADSPANDTQPAVSPDGEQIAFRSSRDGGGIFVMGATGESVRRLSDFGFNPAWSPDGKQIVVASEGVANPFGRTSISHLWAIEVTTGARRELTREDAVQPNWSPDGRRIAFWCVPVGSGQRDLWTLDVASGMRTRVTDDPAVDWCPVWSPDGQHIYFSSDRGGTLNLWRVAVNPATGSSGGQPEPVTVPAPAAGPISISRLDGSIAYASTHVTAQLVKVPFDPGRRRVTGSSVQVTGGTLLVSNFDVSPDGNSIAFTNTGTPEDLFMIGADGRGLRQLTSDIEKDRGPAWAPDGKRLVLYSSRGGKYDIYTINPDGSGLKPLTQSAAGDRPLWFPKYAPDGTKMLAVNEQGTFVFDSDAPPRKIIPLTNPEKDGLTFRATDWSPDGKRIAGFAMAPDGRPRGLLIYSLETKEYRSLAGESSLDLGSNPSLIWLADNRTLLVSNRRGMVVAFDLDRGQGEEILPPLPKAERTFLRVSPDNRWIYYIERLQNSNIWLMTTKE